MRVKQEVTWLRGTYLKVTKIQNQRLMDEEKLKKYSNVDNCPVRNIIDRIGDKWSILVLLLLEDEGVLRFNEIHKLIDSISQKMLTVTLKKLEADGLINRKVYAQIPPKVEYELSDTGVSLMPPLHGLVGWALDHFDDIVESRKVYETIN